MVIGSRPARRPPCRCTDVMEFRGRWRSSDTAQTALKEAIGRIIAGLDSL